MIAAGTAGGGGPTPASLDTAAAIFGMLATPTRLHLMWLLAHGDHDVGGLADLVGASVAAVSQHLAKLRLAGLVTARRAGRHHIYTADDPHILLLVEQVFEHVRPRGAGLGFLAGERRQMGLDGPYQARIRVDEAQPDNSVSVGAGDHGTRR